MSLVCGVGLELLSSIAFTLLRERERELAAVCILSLFLMVPWVSLQSVVVVFPGHTHFHFSEYLRLDIL